MLLYEVDGKMLTAQEVFRLYGNGSSSEEEQNNAEPLFTKRTKTVITYLSETGSSSDSDDSDLSSLTSSGSDISSEDNEEFRKAQVNGTQPNKPLKSVLKKPTAVPQRRDSLHSTEEVDLTARTSLGPKQLQFHGGSNGGFTPDVSSPATSASPPSILKRTQNIQIMGVRPPGISSPATRIVSRSVSPRRILKRTQKNESMIISPASGTTRGDSSRRSTAKTNSINNIQNDLEGALQHIKSMFPSPEPTSGVQDIRAQIKPKVVTESNALAIDYSEWTSPATRLTSEQSNEFKTDDGSQLRMEYRSPSSVGAVRHICDDTRVLRSVRKWRSQSKSQRSSIQSLSSITHHSLNQPQTEGAFLFVADNEMQSNTPQPQIPDLEDPVNPNRVHLPDDVKEITDSVAALQTQDSNEGSLVSRDSGKLVEHQANTEPYSHREFIEEEEDQPYETDAIMKSVGEKHNSSQNVSVGLNANLYENSFETEPTAKADGDYEATGSTEMYETTPTTAHSVRSGKNRESKNRNSRSGRGSSSSDVVNVNPKLSTRTSRGRVEKPCRREKRSNFSDINRPRKKDKYSENGEEMDAQRIPIQQNELRRGRFIEQPKDRKRRGKSNSKHVKEKNSQKHEIKAGSMSAKRLAQIDAHALEERRTSEDRQSQKHVAAKDKQEGTERSYEGDAWRENTPWDASKTMSISNKKLQKDSSNIHSYISGEVGENYDIPPHLESPSGMNEPDQEYLSSSMRPPTLDDVDNYDIPDDSRLGLYDDADANDMKQSEIRSLKETEGSSFRSSLELNRANESIRNDRFTATTISTITRKSFMRNSEQEPPSEIVYGKDGRRAAPKKKSKKKFGGLGGSIFRSSISEIGARIWEQEKIEEKKRQEKGLCKGLRRSKRLRLKPQFHDRPVLEIDEYTGLPSYKKDEEGNVVLENRLRRTPPKKNLKRNRKKSRRKRKRRRLQAEREQIDLSYNEDDSSNRKTDHDEVIPATQYVWAYSEENPKKEHKIRVTKEFLNVDFKVMDPETELKGGKALEVGKCATGFLEIPPGQRKRQEISAQTEIYVILKAPMKSLKVKMGEYAWHLSANDVFIIPKNNTYYLENLHLKSSILLTFVLVKNSEDDRSVKKGKKKPSRRKQRKRNSKSESSGRRDDILTE